MDLGGVMARKVCDFCLSESNSLFGGPEKIAGGHHVCKNCKSIIQSYGLPVKYELFQMLVTAQKSMIDMIMDAYAKNHDPDEMLAKFYPLPNIQMHSGEHCLNAVKAVITVRKEDIPTTEAVKAITEVNKQTVHNIPDAAQRTGTQKVEGMLYETEAALYFISKNFVNCHRLGYVLKDRDETDRIMVQTKKKSFTYIVKNADLFFLRERMYRKVNGVLNNKDTNLIYISNDNEVTITPGIYDIPKNLRPGKYEVKPVNALGLHVRDQLGRVTDYYEDDISIDLSAGGSLESTGEYKLKWIGEMDE
jgi:hypothetical protein